MRIHAYTIASAAYRPWLAHWIHWHRERFDTLNVFVHDADPECCVMCHEAGVRLIGYPHPPEEFHDSIYRNRLWKDAHERHPFGDWYLCNDVDEVFDLRHDPRALAREVHEAGNVYCWCEMISRCPADGKMAPLPADPAALFQAFPVDFRTHGTPIGSHPWKPAFRRTDMWGLHTIEHRPSRKWHDKRQFALHHFNFCAEGLDVAKMKQQDLRYISRQYKVLERMLTHGVDVERVKIDPPLLAP